MPPSSLPPRRRSASRHGFLRCIVPLLVAACSETSAPGVPAVVAAIEAGPRQTCALTDSARAFCWGGVARPPDPADSLATATPRPVRGNLEWQSIGVGDGFACGRTLGVEVQCWALSAFTRVPDGRIGDPNPAPVADDPHFLTGLRVGAGHVCALGAGVAYCWGDNLRGQLGIGAFGGILWNHRETPTPVAGNLQFSALSLGVDWTCGLTTGGDVYCWGGGTGGPEGVPGSVVSGQAMTTVETGGPPASRDRTCGLTGTGTLYCWGTFQLGTPQLTAVTPPTGVTFGTPRIGGTITVQDPQTFAFQWHACTLATAGQVFCWGENFKGQLGDGTTTAHSAPAPAAGALRFTWISTGGVHTCGVTLTGEAYCWGSNAFGQLGTGRADSTPVTAPVLVQLVHP